MNSLNVEETDDINSDKDNASNNIGNNFYVKYNPKIRAVVTRILTAAGQPQNIDDCVSAVFLEIMEKLRQYNEMRGSMAAFVTVITRSVSLNYCRDNKRKIYELVGGDKIDFISEPLKFENEVEFNMLVESLFEQLNKKERALFTMRFILFYPSEEIAKTLGITRNAADVRLNRMKNKIKNILTKGGMIL